MGEEIGVDERLHFRTAAVQSLADSYWGEFNIEHPFLDKSYSPSTHMPFMDLTLYVSEWIEDHDEDALYELWSYIGGFCHKYAMKEALRMRVPEGLEISDFAKNEMLAIYALALREELTIGGGQFPGALMLATVFSTRGFSMSKELSELIRPLVRQELKRRAELCNEGEDVDIRTAEIMSAAEGGISGFERFASLLKPIPPSVAAALSGCVDNEDADDLWHLRIHYDLGYGERGYGCSAKIGREYAESLGVLRSIDPTKLYATNALTKAMVSGGLIKRGIGFKKSASKGELIGIAETVPGLMREIIDTVLPDYKTISDEYKAEALLWRDRNALLVPFAQAVMTIMGLTRIRQISRKATFDEVLKNQAKMVIGERRYVEEG